MKFMQKGIQFLPLAFVVTALAVVGFTPAPVSQSSGAGCTGGATAEDAWCCECNSESCAEVLVAGVWSCEGPNECEDLPCTIKVD